MFPHRVLRVAVFVSGLDGVHGPAVRKECKCAGEWLSPSTNEREAVLANLSIWSPSSSCYREPGRGFWRTVFKSKALKPGLFS